MNHSKNDLTTLRRKSAAAALRASPAHARAKNIAAPLHNAKRKFLRFFPGGFRDETYLTWERGYKWEAHREWEQYVNQTSFRAALSDGRYTEIASTAVRIESGRSLLFSFEKMAIRDAVREVHGAKIFAEGLFAFLYGDGSLETRFDRWWQWSSLFPANKPAY